MSINSPDILPLPLLAQKLNARREEDDLVLRERQGDHPVGHLIWMQPAHRVTTLHNKEVLRAQNALNLSYRSRRIAIKSITRYLNDIVSWIVLLQP